ncbi:MAG: NAD(P)/FAD-dependent oxidoreductase [Cyanobacteria bacterium]|nr:NAD(P)/FAD-dependent oxidoreductase [Cyanobacteriota bacterium]
MINSQERWAIVGGGMLGMTLAYRLAQAGKQVTLFEAAPELGGLASAWQLGDIVWDRHYHVTLLSDLRFRALLQELDLEQDMRWVKTKTGVYAKGTLYSVSNAVEFLKFPPLRLIDKLRLAATILYASQIKNWQRLEKISVAQWLKRWSGKRTFATFWKPLLRAKLGDNYKIASAAFIWATIARLYAARNSGLKEEMFGYLPGGYSRILKCFAQRLTDDGVKILTRARVGEIRKTDSQQMQVTYQSAGESDTQLFDQVVVTAAAPIAAQLCKGLSPDEYQRLHGIAYQGIVCASLVLKQPISPYYVTNITDGDVPFTGIIEMTALLDPDEFEGRTLVYLPKYLPTDDPDLNLSDGELKMQFLGALKRMYPQFQPADVLEFKVSRVKYVMALSTLNYSTKLPPMNTSVSGLHIVNSAHIVNGTLNVNETVQLAETAVGSLLTQSRKINPLVSAG